MKKYIILFVLIVVQSMLYAGNEPFEIREGGLVVKFDFYGNSILKSRLLLPETFAGDINLLPVSKQSDIEVSLHITGQNRDSHAGVKSVGCMPGMILEYESLKQQKIGLDGTEYIITLFSPDRLVKVESVYEFYSNTNCVRRYSRVTNLGNKSIGIDCLSSAMINNIANIGAKTLQEKMLFYRAYSGWQAEARWQAMSAMELGYGNNGQFQLSPISITNTGSFSSVKELPMGVVVNKEANLTWFWQIEHNGSWHVEFGDVQYSGSNPLTYMYLGGPDEEHHNAWKELKPGQTYQSIPVAVGCVEGGFNEAIVALTRYRRKACLSKHVDNEKVPVIFNDYMNCLSGNPSAEKEFPLIKAAAKCKSDYYVIDAGWYAELDREWWDEVGLWMPSRSRWPRGLTEVLDSIRANGMIPGLWLEIERVGINSPLSKKPDNWFFMRHGKRIISNSSYQLDFRNPEVREYASKVVDRLVNDYQIGYIKMDYNINIGVGTDLKASSSGQGLLEHQRAYLMWLKSIYRKYPSLVIENCSSGGCRMDYAMLSVNQIQSSSDQTDYLKYPAILVGAMAAVLPEQLAVWSYPMPDSDPKSTSFNMVSSMLCRIHQSGHLANLSLESFEQVRKGIEIYKSSIAAYIPQAVPFFPLGLPRLSDKYSPIAVGLDTDTMQFIAVWRFSGAKTVELDSVHGECEILYPSDLGISLKKFGEKVSITFPSENMACIIQILKK